MLLLKQCCQLLTSQLGYEKHLLMVVVKLLFEQLLNSSWLP